MKSTDDYIANLANQADNAKGAALVGYDGHVTPNTLFTLTASSVAVALDSIADAIDDIQNDFAGTSGAASVGYNGQTGANALFSITSGTSVEAALDLIVLNNDAEMKVVDDYVADVLSQTATKGSALVGYNGQAGANTLFTLTASQVDAALDSIVTGLDAEMKSTDDYIANLASQTATKGSALVGYDGQAGANTLFTLTASQVDAALDNIVTGLDAEMKSTDDYIANLLSQVSTKGSALVGYDGQTGSNSQFSLNASQLDAALDAIVNAIDSDKQDIDNLVTNINGLNYNYTSSTPALVHTITHSLNTDYLMYTVWINDSGSWVNDIVQVTKTDNNSLAITLQESQNVKVSITAIKNVGLTV
jgi:hypothetical protein